MTNIKKTISISLISSLILSLGLPAYAQEITKNNTVESKQKTKKPQNRINNKIIQPKSIDLNKSATIPNNYSNNSNTSINITYIPQGTYYVINMNKNDGTTLTNDDFIPLSDGQLIKSYWMKSTLDYIEEDSLHLNDSNKFVVTVNHKKHACEALYISYHLKGEEFPVTRATLTGAEGNAVEKMDSKCPIPKLYSKDNVGMTKETYIAGFHWAKPSLNTHTPVTFTGIITRQSEDLFPANFKSYAVSKDFTNFYTFTSINNQRGPSYGVKFSQFIPNPDTYFFSMQFISEAGENNKFITKANVLP